MFRIKTVEESAAEGPVKDLYSGIRENMGTVPNVLKVMSGWPEMLEAFMNYAGVLMFSPSELPQDLKEKIAAVVSHANQCPYCVTHHINFQTRYGVDDKVAQSVGENFRNADIPDSEKTLLAFAEKTARDATKVTDGDVENLRQAGFSDRQILEATFVVGHFCSLNRIADALGVELEADPNWSKG